MKFIAAALAAALGCASAVPVTHIPTVPELEEQSSLQARGIVAVDVQRVPRSKAGNEELVRRLRASQAGQPTTVGHNKFARVGVDATGKVGLKEGDSFPSVNLLDVQNELWVGDVQLGSPAQGPFSVVFDSGSSNLWLPNTLCLLAGCKNRDKYNPSKSSKYVANGENFFIPYGTGSVYGKLAADDLQVAGLTVTNTTFGMAEYMAEFFAQVPQIDGILGLAYENIAVDHVEPVLDTMAARGVISSASFSTYFSSEWNSTDSKLFFGGAPQEYYDGTMTYAAVSLPSYYLVTMGKYGAGSFEHKCALGDCPAVIDTGTSAIVMSTKGLIDQIPAVNADCSNVSSLPTISFTFDGVDYPLEPEYYVLTVPSSDNSDELECVLGIEYSLLSAPLNIIGDPFFRKYFTYFDKANNRVGFAKAKKPSEIAKLQQ